MKAVLPHALEFYPMQAADLDAVAQIEAGIQAFPWSRGNFADSLHAGYSAWVARLPDRLIGFSVVMQVLDEAHILTIGISSSLQGQGYGARLLQHAMHQVTTHGARRLLLEVRPSNARAVALYRNFGFQQIGVRKGYYPATEGREDGLVFQKELA